MKAILSLMFWPAGSDTQVETKGCLEAIDDVLAVPGVTCAFLGGLAHAGLVCLCGLPGRVGRALLCVGDMCEQLHSRMCCVYV